MAEIRRKFTSIGLVAAEALEPSFFERAQQLRLADERQIADFIEEQRAVVRHLETPGLPIVRAGERPLLVTKQFGLEQRIGKRGAVDALELVGAAAAQLVNHPRNHFLAGSGGPEDEHRNVRLRRGSNPLEHDEHLFIAADHFAEALNGGGPIFVADRCAPLEKFVEQIADRRVRRLLERVARDAASCGLSGDAKRHELAHAVFDVEPHPAERLHQRFDVERFFRPRAQESQQSGAQWRLDQRMKAGLDFRRIDPAVGH